MKKTQDWQYDDTNLSPEEKERKEKLKKWFKIMAKMSKEEFKQLIINACKEE